LWEKHLQPLWRCGHCYGCLFLLIQRFVLNVDAVLLLDELASSILALSSWLITYSWKNMSASCQHYGWPSPCLPSSLMGFLRLHTPGISFSCLLGSRNIVEIFSGCVCQLYS
jgi:hypothetical protein